MWVTDCYTIKFILSYKGGNPAILRLQMRLMCWDVDIVHRPNMELVDADYWSRLGVDIELDPLFKKSISNSHARFATQILRRQIYPCVPRTCPTTVGRVTNSQYSQRVQMPTHCTFRAYSRISPFPPAGVILISKTYLSIGAILATGRSWSHGNSLTQSLRYMPVRQQKTIGPCTRFPTDIFLHRSRLTVCPSPFASHVIPANPVALCSMSLRHRLPCSARETIY